MAIPIGQEQIIPSPRQIVPMAPRGKSNSHSLSADDLPVANRGTLEEAASESLAGYEILSKQTNPAVSFLRAARQDLAAAYDSLRQPEKAARFKAELPESK